MWLRPGAEGEDALKPAQQVTVQRLAAPVESVAAVRVEDQLLRRSCPAVDFLSRGCGQDLVVQAVSDQQRSRRDRGHSFGPAGLAAERRDRNGPLARRA